MPSEADGPLITSMRPMRPMSVNVPERLPSRSGDVWGMPSKRRSAVRPRKVSPELLMACDDSE